MRKSRAPAFCGSAEDDTGEDGSGEVGAGEGCSRCGALCDCKNCTRSTTFVFFMGFAAAPAERAWYKGTLFEVIAGVVGRVDSGGCPHFEVEFDRQVGTIGLGATAVSRSFHWRICRQVGFSNLLSWTVPLGGRFSISRFSALVSTSCNTGARNGKQCSTTECGWAAQQKHKNAAICTGRRVCTRLYGRAKLLGRRSEKDVEIEGGLVELKSNSLGCELSTAGTSL